MREVVREHFPEAPGLPEDKGSYLESVDDIYKSDAYHSLSIEGYSVTPALIERVQQGSWDPAHHEEDRKNRDALAARGCWQAFQNVKEAVADIIAGANPGARAHHTWTGIGNCFSPSWPLASFQLPLLRAIEMMLSTCAPLATCPRDGRQCATRCRRYSICWRTKRTSASVRSSDTGRSAISTRTRMATDEMARFVMNAMLPSGGYPWTVIRG